MAWKFIRRLYKLVVKKPKPVRDDAFIARLGVVLGWDTEPVTEPEPCQPDVGKSEHIQVEAEHTEIEDTVREVTTV